MNSCGLNWLTRVFLLMNLLEAKVLILLVLGYFYYNFNTHILMFSSGVSTLYSGILPRWLAWLLAGIAVIALLSDMLVLHPDLHPARLTLGLVIQVAWTIIVASYLWLATTIPSGSTPETMLSTIIKKD
jgi:hypothetical protein